MTCGICKSDNPPHATSCETCGALLAQAFLLPQPSPPPAEPPVYAPPVQTPTPLPSGPVYSPAAPPPSGPAYSPAAPPPSGPAYGPAAPPQAPQHYPTAPPPPQVGSFDVRVSGRILSWPQKCACCSGPSDTNLRAEHTRTTGKRVVRTDTRHWDVPYCSHCLHHAQLAQSGANQYSSGRNLAIISGLFFWCGIPLIGVIIGIVMMMNGNSTKNRARLATMATCCCPEPAVTYNGWDGSILLFTFRNGIYAEAFRRANARKLLNS